MRALRVVFNANVVASTLLFRNGRLQWLREHWQSAQCDPLISKSNVEELQRIFLYSKFKMQNELKMELLSLYLSSCEVIHVNQVCTVECRDAKDQKYLNLAVAGNADVLVTGDEDLLVLNEQLPFVIETPAEYKKRFE
jgi:putative PIN family toxin of toxin-antitoxin system